MLCVGAFFSITMALGKKILSAKFLKFILGGTCDLFTETPSYSCLELFRVVDQLSDIVFPMLHTARKRNIRKSYWNATAKFVHFKIENITLGALLILVQQ